MNLTSILRKFSAGEWHYAFGRFETIRRGYSAWRRLTSRLPEAPDPENTLFPESLHSRSLENLRRDAVAFNFNLPMDYVLEIQNFAKTAPGVRKGDNFPFQYSDVQNGFLPDGSPIAIGTILDAERCPAIARIISDPGLFYLISQYLGYQPRSIKPRLFWSFVTPLAENERLKSGQTVLFHFDVDGFNFAYANFYLTDVDSQSGAHVMIKKSHRAKPFKMLFHSANQTDENVISQFGLEKQIIISGKAGTGFVQDSSCFHKALAPIHRERLMLQLRFN